MPVKIVLKGGGTKPQKKSRLKDNRGRWPRKIPYTADDLFKLYAELDDPDLLKRIQYLSDHRMLVDPQRWINKDDRDARMAYMHRCVLRRVPVGDVCEALKISRPRYYQLMAELKNRVRMDAEHIDVPQYIGESLTVYADVRASALMMSTNPHCNRETQLNALRVVLSAENARNDFLAKIGVYSDTVLEKLVKALVEKQYSPHKQPAMQAITFLDQIAHAISGKALLQGESPVET